MIKYNLEGQKFGRMLVLRRANILPEHRRRAKWHCQCECGVEKICDGAYLRQGKIKSCGCYNREVARNSRRLTPGEAGKNQLFLKYKLDAHSKKREFCLNKELFTKITQERCHYCNAEPSRTYRNNGGRSLEAREYSSYKYNGIDRKNNNEGYTEKNCVPCCTRCNYMKKDMDYDVFLELIRTIANIRGLK